MAEGIRGLLAPWVGGAADDPAPAPTPGVRGMLAPWLGGAGVEAAPTATAGARSLLAFWMGGAGMGQAVAQTATGGARRRQLVDEDEEFLVMLAAILPHLKP